MILSYERIVESIQETLDGLAQRGDLPKDVAADLAIAAALLHHTRYVDRSSGEDMRSYGVQCVELLLAMKSDESIADTAGAPIRALLDDAMSEAHRVEASPLRGNQLKRPFADFLDRLDDAFGRIARRDRSVSTPLFAGFAERLVKHHNDLRLFAEDETCEFGVSTGEPLTTENLTVLMRDKLADPGAVVTKISRLSGGFGKETSVFSVTSGSLTGDLVMRRDAPIEFRAGLGCHTADQEFPLLRAVYGQGFPVPEPLWCEQDSKIIKGPAFTVMRHAPGQAAGDSTGGETTVPRDLQRTLAQVAARLHAMPRLPELDHIRVFKPALWDQAASECTRGYMSAWYEQYLDHDHLPLPAIHALVNWMLANVPACDEAPVLVHADIGFHNLLFRDGKLSAVLDWECSHVGDPAEDLGYIRSVMGHQLDWAEFLHEYRKAGRPVPSEQRVRFFEIWSHVKNALSILLASKHFEAGRLRNIKYGIIVYRFLPHFLSRAETLIAAYDKPGS